MDVLNQSRAARQRSQYKRCLANAANGDPCSQSWTLMRRAQGRQNFKMRYYYTENIMNIFTTGFGMSS
jgi:hypothetical protein